MKALFYILFFGVFLVLYVRFLENRTLFVPSKEVLANPRQIGLDFEDVYFETSDNIKLNGWLVPAKNAKATVLFCHGNAGNIGDRLGKIRIFHDLGLNVFIFDYRGYGRSEGSPSEKGMYLDARAAYDYLSGRDEFQPDTIYVYGASLGGAAAIDIASRRKIAGMIIDSSFSNAVDMAKHIYPFVPSFLVRIKLNSLEKIKKVDKPSLFFHSVDDEIVPYILGRKLFEAANQPKRFVDLQGNHNDSHLNSESVFVANVKEFIAANNL